LAAKRAAQGYPLFPRFAKTSRRGDGEARRSDSQTRNSDEFLMEAVEAIYLLHRLGLSLVVNEGRLDVSPAELLDSDSTWLIRSHKAAIVSELQNDAPRWAWLLHFADREPLEVYCNPDATHAEILERYARAMAAEPIPERVAPIYEVAWPDAETVSSLVSSEVGE
jgi:hypothetical protein